MTKRKQYYKIMEDALADCIFDLHEEISFRYNEKYGALTITKKGTDITVIKEPLDYDTKVLTMNRFLKYCVKTTINEMFKKWEEL